MVGRSASTVEQRWTRILSRMKRNFLPLITIQIVPMAMPGEVQAAPWAAMPGESAPTGRVRFASAPTTRQYRWRISLKMGRQCPISRG